MLRLARLGGGIVQVVGDFRVRERRPNQVPYQNRNGNSTSSTANPVISKYARRLGRREVVVGVTADPSSEHQSES